nr:hypothetical protein [Mycoplasmopsis bovis]
MKKQQSELLVPKLVKFLSSDLLLAQASNAIIIAFNVKVSPNIKQTAKQSNIKIMSYDVIYKIVEDMQSILDGEKPIVYEERKIGSAHCVKLFFYSKVGTIAGCMQDEGVVKLGCKVQIFRNKKMIQWRNCWNVKTRN